MFLTNTIKIHLATSCPKGLTPGGNAERLRTEGVPFTYPEFFYLNLFLSESLLDIIWVSSAAMNTVDQPGLGAAHTENNNPAS